MDVPELKAIETAITEAQTDVAPFIPQSQGVKEADLVDANSIPRGNAIPINSPIGKSITVATKIRGMVINHWNPLIAYGVAFPKIASVDTRRIRRTSAEVVIPEWLII